jgi:hypothetical protein
VGGTTPLKSLTVNSTGSSVVINASITATGNINIDPPDTITVAAPITSTGGNVNLAANNDVTLSGANADITTSGGTVTIDADADNNATGTFTSNNTGSAIASGAGNVTVIAADVALTGTIAGTGTITLQPSTAARTIGVGGGAGDFNVDDTELTKLTNGFSSITIGDAAAGTGAVDVGSRPTQRWIERGNPDRAHRRGHQCWFSSQRVRRQRPVRDAEYCHRCVYANQ